MYKALGTTELNVTDGSSTNAFPSHGNDNVLVV